MNGRSGFEFADDGTPMDDREKIDVMFDPAEVEIAAHHVDLDPPHGLGKDRVTGLKGKGPV